MIPASGVVRVADLRAVLEGLPGDAPVCFLYDGMFAAVQKVTFGEDVEAALREPWEAAGAPIEGVVLSDERYASAP